MSLLRDRGDSAEHLAQTESEELLAQIAQSADAMRAGHLVRVEDRDNGAIAIAAVETAGQSGLQLLESGSAPPVLILTHARARTLKIPLYTPCVSALRAALPLNIERLRAIADPTSDLEAPLKGPFDAVRKLSSSLYPAALRLAKMAGLLPAVLSGPGALAQSAVAISAGLVDKYDELVVRTLKIVAKARVPIAGAEQSEIAIFRAGGGEPEHYAIIIGNPPTGRPVLARLHSECFTGDLLASLRCDCGAQLRGAVDAIIRNGGGVLLYLAQEGRGIGLANKLRAYRLQDQGFDTFEANERLGFESDERLYAIAGRMLTLLGFQSVRLLTNNPHKVEALQAAGVTVTERVPHAFPANPHNANYLRTKAEKSGHLLK